MLYTFFTAMLPTLELSAPPPMTLEDFDALARNELSRKDYQKLIDPESNLPVCVKYRRLEEFFSFRIARKRAEQLHWNCDFPEPEACFAEIEAFLPSVWGAADSEQRERNIDKICWQCLDDLETGHDFDLEHLAVYRLRLKLLQKYAVHDSERGAAAFEKIVARQTAARP